jgi:hypothetical protein
MTADTTPIGGRLLRGVARLWGDVPGSAALIAYAGLGPMVAGFIVVFAGGIGAVGRDTALAILTRYAAVALTFLAGIRWGTAIRLAGGTQDILAILAGPLIVLLAWIATLLPAPAALGLLAAGFAAQGAWDVWTADLGRLPAWYGGLRLRLTLIAVGLLVLTLFALLR